MCKIDTSIEGFKYAGINLTEHQYEDLLKLNVHIITSENGQEIPIFTIMMTLKILGLLPAEMVNNVSGDNCYNNSNNDFPEQFQRKFGKIKN